MTRFIDRSQAEPIYHSFAREGLASHFDALQATVAGLRDAPALSDEALRAELQYRWGAGSYQTNVMAALDVLEWLHERGHGRAVDALVDAGYLHKPDVVEQLAKFGRALTNPATERGYTLRTKLRAKEPRS